MLSEKNKHPRDERIVFQEKGHLYSIDGSCKGYDSVTTFIGKYFSKFKPDEVIKRHYDKWQTKPSHKYYGMKPEEIKKTWDKKGKKASQQGTNLHLDIENYLNGKKVVNKSTEWRYFKEFMDSVHNFKPYRTEWCIFDEDLKLAGSIDALFQDKAGNFVIIDWKRSKSIDMSNPFDKGLYPLQNIDACNFYKYSLQLSMYKQILQTKYNLNVKGLFLVQLFETNNTFKVFACDDMEKEINLLVRDRKQSL